MRAALTILVVTMALSSFAPTARAQADEHLASCEADATAANVTGDARKSYMSTCLSRKAGQANTNAAREKLKSCNAQASEKNLVEGPRKAFVDNCVKGFVL